MRIFSSLRAEHLVRRPLAVLFAAAGAEAVLGGAVNVTTLAWQGNVTRLRHLEPFAILVRSLARLHVDALAHLPQFMRVTWDMTSPWDVLKLLAPAITIYLLFSLAVALLLAPLVAAAARLFPRGRAKRSADRFWTRVYPAAVIVLFAVPALQTTLHTVLGRLVWRPVSLTTTLASAVAWVFLALALRTTARVARLLHACVVVAAAMLVLSAGLSLAAAAGARRVGTAQRPSAPGAPNVLLVSIDALRADHLHCYGYVRETSPTIDALASDGVRFATVVAPTSWTLPSHLTLLTGIPPEAHGVVRDYLRLRPGTVTLAEALREAGYSTAGFVSAPYVASEYGFSKGFDLYDDWSAGSTSRKFNHKLATSPALAGLVERWLGTWVREKPRRPFFLFVHMFDVHADYTPPPPFDSLFDPGYTGWVTGANVENNSRFGPATDPRDLAHLEALYDGEIRFTDQYLGTVLDRLRSLGVLDNTIVVITADHGEEFLEHGHTTHRNNLYDTSILVPLVMRFPRKLPADLVVPQQVRLMDVAPTVLALAGVSPPAAFGRITPGGPRACTDLSAVAEGRTLETAQALPAFADLHGELAALRDGHYKLVESIIEPATQELYDLAADPGERTNLADRYPAVATELHRDLLEWRRVWSSRRAASQPLALDDDLVRRLRSLGYLQ